MKPVILISLSALALAACAPARTMPASAPPAPVRPESVSTPTPPPTAIGEAPRNWQLLDAAADHVPGISAERAVRELLANKQPKRVIVVAIIDGGVDTAHAALRSKLWANPKETPGNGKDDDNNGYVDDVRGWNFIGGRDGRDVQHEALEVTRLYASCTAKGVKPEPLPASEQGKCPQITADYEKQRAEAEQGMRQVRMAGDALTRATQILARALGPDSLTPARVAALRSTQSDVQQAQQVYMQLAAGGITPAVVEEAKTQYESQLQYGLNPSYDPRSIVGDNPADVTERRYGNNDVMGPDALHGTHVAGIVAAASDSGVRGIAPNARIMSVRTVPDGDERDKDVANAIRYAVDNGANVINMSFGKAYSPFKDAVDEAVEYADAHGVLMVHAAGNDGEDLSQNNNFPMPTYQGGGKAQSWIEVGASSWKGADSLAASFSNYGRAQVDVFAPGVDILSTVPGGGYKRESGTSMAAPVVTGLAALLMSYYPTLTAADVKRIILTSAARYADQLVVRPGSGDKVPFGSLSATGGIVNAYNAIRMAEAMSAVKP